MIVRDRRSLRRVGIGQRCIDDVLHTGTNRGLNGCPVLFDPHARRVKGIGTDEEQALGPPECCLQGLGPIEISLPLFYTQSGEFSLVPGVRVAAMLFRSEPPKLRHDGLSQVSTGARHEKLLVCKTHFHLQSQAYPSGNPA